MTSTSPPLRAGGATLRRPIVIAPATLRALVAVVVVALNALVLVHFHDRSWWPPDEGNYAHVAERILDGEVLHADVQDIHPGYVNFANAGAMALFGRQLVSMRYPLVALGVAQAALVFALLAPIGLLVASVAATAITALGFVQFLDPTAHWYALFLAVLLVSVVHAIPARRAWRADAIGAVVGAAVLFRQLSGVFIAMAALTVLLLEEDGPRCRATPSASATPPDTSPPAAPRLARALVLVMLAGLVGYLARGTNALGWMLFGIWPVLVLLWTLGATRMPDVNVVALAGRLARGTLVVAAPLLIYHALHGSLGDWYGDAIVTAIGFPRLPFFDLMSYGSHLGLAAGAVASGDLPGVVNGALWCVLPFVAATVGLLTLRALMRDGYRNVGPLPIVAVFYGVVSVHYQIPIYLTYTVGLSLVALLWLAHGRWLVTVAVAAMLPVALYYQAAQPLSRGVPGAVNGRRTPVVPSAGLPRLGLRIESADVALYRALIGTIHRESRTGDAILAIPSRAELYFLAERRNPFRFYNSALGIRTDRDLDRVLRTLVASPPALVIFDPSDKYNTAESEVVMARIRSTYDRLPNVGRFEIHRHRSPVVAAGRVPPSMSQ